MNHAQNESAALRVAIVLQFGSVKGLRFVGKGAALGRRDFGENCIDVSQRLKPLRCERSSARWERVAFLADALRV
jgi:hypothetical protein